MYLGKYRSLNSEATKNIFLHVLYFGFWVSGIGSPLYGTFIITDSTNGSNGGKAKKNDVKSMTSKQYMDEMVVPTLLKALSVVNQKVRTFSLWHLLDLGYGNNVIN